MEQSGALRVSLLSRVLRTRNDLWDSGFFVWLVHQWLQRDPLWEVGNNNSNYCINDDTLKYLLLTEFEDP